jgi:hypothetical protein
LIESGERPVPKDWKWIISAAQVYSVSVDYILGLSPHPERDAIAAGDLGNLAYLVVDTEMEAHQHEFE